MPAHISPKIILAEKREHFTASWFCLAEILIPSLPHSITMSRKVLIRGAIFTEAYSKEGHSVLQT